MLNMSDKMEEEIKKELSKIDNIVKDGKASLYSFGCMYAYNKVLEICKNLDDMDINQINELYYRTIKESIFEEDYEGGK